VIEVDALVAASNGLAEELIAGTSTVTVQRDHLATSFRMGGMITPSSG
jgi:hypothetical protein